VSHLNQDLHNAFPDDAEALRRLKANDSHFQALAERFDALDEEARRIETGVEPGSDVRLEDIKKRRLALLDEIAGLVAAERN
jgi:uncharacterized protein YdcH (DUF465 family)